MMWRVRRGDWRDIDLDDTNETVMVHPGWTNDRETLAGAYREAGWFFTAREAFEAAENADLKWGWIGVSDTRTVVICDSGGIAHASGEGVDDVLQVTLARITTDA
jgi:hypothetical protein